MNNHDLSEDGTSVGYKHPPKRSQFKPGQSGNPKGRPKRVQGVTYELHEILNRPMRLAMNGTTQEMSSFEAMMWKQVEKALKGDIRAFNALIKQATALGVISLPPPTQGYGVLAVGPPLTEEAFQAKYADTTPPELDWAAYNALAAGKPSS